LQSNSIPWWHPEALRRRRPYLQARARIVATLRNFFLDAGFSEIETPALQVSPGMEPHLLAFATELQEPGGGHRAMYLHTSPEFAMKKLLAAGSGPIFQFARVFRNGERSTTHHPEFTMLEWYRPGAGYRDLMDDCERLLAAALTATGAGEFRWQGRVASPLALQRLTVMEAFQRLAGVDLAACFAGDGLPDKAVLRAAAGHCGVRVSNDDRWDDIFFRIFLERIEPGLGSPHPTAIYDYPIAMAALARAKPENPRLAERFELYVCGLELANAFGELTDPHEQRRRFAADQAAKRALFGFDYPIDAAFLQALHNMPDCAGIALGLDRLVMLCTGAERIEDVLWLPVD